MRLYLRFTIIRTCSWLHELLFRSARRGFPCPLHMHAGLGCDVSRLSIRLSENIPGPESCYLHDMVLHSDGYSSALLTTFGPKWCGNLWKWSMAGGARSFPANVIGELRCGSSWSLSRCRRNGRSRSANQGYPIMQKESSKRWTRYND